MDDRGWGPVAITGHSCSRFMSSAGRTLRAHDSCCEDEARTDEEAEEKKEEEEAAEEEDEEAAMTSHKI